MASSTTIPSEQRESFHTADNTASDTRMYVDTRMYRIRLLLTPCPLRDVARNGVTVLVFVILGNPKDAVVIEYPNAGRGAARPASAEPDTARG
jgi:hypothetical protein